MVQVSYPGVYVEEISSGVRPIEGVSTSTAAFIGITEKGPINKAKKISSWTEFETNYGSYLTGTYLPHSVFQFFNNGGRQCYVVRVAQDAQTADITIRNRAPDPAPESIKISANSPGKWGNYLHLVIADGTDDPNNTFKIEVRMSKEVAKVPDIAQVAPLEVHDNLSMNPEDPNFIVKVLSSQSNLISAEVHKNNSTLMAGSHRSGKLESTFSLPSGTKKRKLRININGDGYQEITLEGEVGDLAGIARAIETTVRKLSPLKASTVPDPFSNFTCSVVDVDEENKKLVLTSGASGPTSTVKILNATIPDENIASFLKLGLTNDGSEIHGAAVRRPVNGITYQVGDDTVTGAVTAVTPGSDGTMPITDATYTAGFQLLNDKDDVNLICVPGIGSRTVVDAGLNYCRNRPLQDCFFIGDMDSTDDTPDEAKEFRNALTTPNSYGAIYFPWLKATDPTGRSSAPILLPPSGFVAGMYAQIDAKRGVWKAPAGTEAVIGGAVGLAVNLTDTQQGDLNKKAVNCLRQFPASGIVIWGARALSSDPEWKYIPVRRMAIFLRVSIYYGIQWAVFEPNDEELWSALRLNIGAFMMRLFRDGAFQGSTPSEAFFVKCDKETTTQADIDVGVVNILVGFAPLKPAEFVVVKITQKAGQQ